MNKKINTFLKFELYGFKFLLIDTIFLYEIKVRKFIEFERLHTSMRRVTLNPRYSF